MFMLIIWLQGIWLPLHGYDFARTPLWAGIYMLPLTTGSSSPDRPPGCCPTAMALGPFATGGMLLTAFTSLARAAPGQLHLLGVRPASLMMGLSNGLFMSPNGRR